MSTPTAIDMADKENGSLASVPPPHMRLRVAVSAIFALSLAAASLDGPLSKLFQWHPILMTVGYAWLMVEGVAAGKAMVRSRSVEERFWWRDAHMYLLFFALCAICGGFGVIFYNKSVGGRPHFTSWHGFGGVVAVGVYVVQTVLGFVIYSGLCGKLGVDLPSQYKVRRLHAVLAYVAVLLGACAFGLGLLSNFAVARWGVATRAMIGVMYIGLHIVGIFC